MDILEALMLGIVQGLTEWLPISSSGHLVIAEEALGLSAGMNLVFDLILHLGTLCAVVVFFRKELARIVTSIVKLHPAEGSQEEKLRFMGILLLIGTIPAAIAGVLFKDAIEQVFDIRYVGIALIANAIMLFSFERFWAKGTKKDAKLLDAIVIGLFQAVAIIPGISRSGSTISGGMLRGLERETAAVFAFLLSVPTLVGAFVYGFLTLNKFDTDLASSIVGFGAAFLVGLVSIEYLLKAVRSGKLWIFSIYCAVVGAAVAILTL
jgi:undecaprenyl-diphosphatase